jgi:hypothetical protein
LTSLPKARVRRLLSWGVEAAIVLAIIGVALSFSSVRDGIGNLFGGDESPKAESLVGVRPVDTLDLGKPVTLEQARDTASFPVLVPTRPGYEKPDAAYFSKTPTGGAVSFLWGPESRPRLLIRQFAADKAFEETERLAPKGALFNYFTVGDRIGAWLLGKRGPLGYRDLDGSYRRDRFRLASNALLWERAPVVVTLEGKLSRREAARIAGSMRPARG